MPVTCVDVPLTVPTFGVMPSVSAPLTVQWSVTSPPPAGSVDGSAPKLEITGSAGFEPMGASGDPDAGPDSPGVAGREGDAERRPDPRGHCTLSIVGAAGGVVSPGSAVLLTVALTTADVVEWPAPSKALAENVCAPLVRFRVSTASV